MITKDKIDIYLRYRGDIDGFILVSTPDEQAIITDNDFSVISNFVQDIILMKRNLVSKEHEDEIKKKIVENKIDEETVELLFKTFSK
jgi:hypothetical protein